MNDRLMARGLAWFGIGLGLAETFAPRRLAAATGLEGHENLIQLYGLREIASGAAILAADEPEQHLGLRVGGDLLDAALLAARATPADPRRNRTLAAALAVAPIVVLDAAIWLKARDRRRRAPRSPADLSCTCATVPRSRRSTRTRTRRSRRSWPRRRGCTDAT
ncbi:hypothetical protein ACU4GR_25040 [Methylobacterium oryzae CBMB20]